MSSTSALPILLPVQNTKTNKYPEWTPQRHLQPPQPPVVDDQRILDLELAVQRQLLDGKALKKTRPRRTVDYAGGMGRWALVCCVSFTLTRLFTRSSVNSCASCSQIHDMYPISGRVLHTSLTCVRSVLLSENLLTVEHGRSFSLQKPILTMPRHRSAQSSSTRPRTKSDVQ